MGQPPSGGCVLKHDGVVCHGVKRVQPPSGGCVLKPKLVQNLSQKPKTSRLRAAVC